MKNIFKFLRGKIAKIIITDNIVNIERQDGQSVIFEANRNNYFIDFNVGMLGGDIERNAHGIMVVVDSNPVDFISGENYLINDIEYYSDVKGKAKIDYDDTFFELFLDLSFGDKYSDILLQTDNKLKDMSARLDSLYDTINDLEECIEDASLRRAAMEEEVLTLDNVYKLLLSFDKIYDIMTDKEKKDLISYLIKDIQIYSNEEQVEMPLKSITLNFPIYSDSGEVNKLLWENQDGVE